MLEGISRAFPRVAFFCMHVLLGFSSLQQPLPAANFHLQPRTSSKLKGRTTCEATLKKCQRMTVLQEGRCQADPTASPGIRRPPHKTCEFFSLPRTLWVCRMCPAAKPPNLNADRHLMLQERGFANQRPTLCCSSCRELLVFSLGWCLEVVCSRSGLSLGGGSRV